MAFVSLPNTGQTLGNTRAQIKTNFDDIVSADDVNHYNVNDPRRGKHTFVDMPNISNVLPPISDPVTAADELAVYSKTFDSVIRLFMREQANGIAQQISGNVITNIAPLNSGETVLFGGVIIKWGVVGGGGTTTFAALSLTDFPNASFGVVATIRTGGGATFSASATVNAITINQGAGTTVFFIALGN